MNTTSVNKFINYLANNNIFTINFPVESGKNNAYITAGDITLKTTWEQAIAIYNLGSFCATDNFRSLGCNFWKHNTPEGVIAKIAK